MTEAGAGWLVLLDEAGQVLRPSILWNDQRTAAECDERLERQLIAHAKPVLKCVPGLKDTPNALAASVSLAYNVGVHAFCRSTVAAKFRQQDIRGACDAFLMWRYAGGREIRGLTNRRNAERMICLRDA